MHRSSSWCSRLVSIAVAFVIVLTAVLSGPTRADAAVRRTTLFRAEFDSAPFGPVTAPLAVETGMVVPQGDTIAITRVPSGQALSIDGSGGQASALFQWSNYPGGLPTNRPREQTLRVAADFTSNITGTTGISGTASTSVGLLAGTDFFEFFSFGPNGTITRGGNSLGIRSAPGTPLHMEVHIVLVGARQNARITLTGAGGRANLVVGLPAAFNPDTLNQIRLQASAGSAAVLVDHVLVQLQTGQGDPPPIIIIRDGDIEQEIEFINGVIFVSIKILIVNSGGPGNGCFLVLNLEDFKELFDLADVGFLQGVGYVRELTENQVVIGLGQYNVIDVDGRVQVKIKFKAKQNRLDIKINAKFRLDIGDESIEVPPVVVVVPPVIVPGLNPIGGTPVLTPTTGISSTVGLSSTVIIVPLPVTRIDVRFRVSWNTRGGLAIFGLPLGDPITRPDGIVVQYFERTRMEWHPELRGTAYEVLLGRLAADLGYGTPPTAVPTSTEELTWYYPATGHLIGSSFRGFWQSRGGLAVFGLPINEAVIENGRLIQYFERARLELHTELAGTPYEIQLGHLGVEWLRSGRQ